MDITKHNSLDMYGARLSWSKVDAETSVVLVGILDEIAVFLSSAVPLVDDKNTVLNVLDAYTDMPAGEPRIQSKRSQ